MRTWRWLALSAMLLTAVFGSTASASTDLELIDSTGDTLLLGTSTGGVLLCDGLASNCAAFGATGTDLASGYAITAASFGGWSVTISTLGSNTPNCPAAGAGGPGCLNHTNITADTTVANSLGVFDYSDGFTVPEPFVVANTSAIQTGLLESQQGYATQNGVDPLGIGTTTYAAAVAGQETCGTALTSVAPGVNASPTGCLSPGIPVSLELATIFTTAAGGGGFDVGGNISAVPEPAAVVLFGTVLALCATGLRRRRNSLLENEKANKLV